MSSKLIMERKPTQKQQALAAKEEVVRMLKDKKEYYIGAGLSETTPHNYAVTVRLKKKLPDQEKPPNLIKGIPVYLKVIGDIFLLSDDFPSYQP